MGVVRFILASAVTLALPALAAAQISTATVIGSVIDESKAVLPGAAIVATDLETGRKYETVSDARGAYQLPPLPPGTYKIEAELSGFARTEVPKLELLVGQNASIVLTMRISAVEENLTVRGETPLVDLSSTQVAGNVDRRQMEAMPLQGRNWLELSLLVKGVTANNVTNSPGVGQNESFNLNLDGQQIKQNVLSSGSGEPRFSREAIAEFQIVTSNFDITQGRSTGVQVQAISKSGTNNLAGAVYGYFRDDSLNAPDPVAHQVLPYSNQQTGFAIGGPIVKDRLHYFFTYEHENNPATVFTQPPQLGGVSYTASSPTKQNSWLVRGDWQMSPRDSLSVRGSHWGSANPFSLGSQTYPSLASIQEPYSANLAATWSRIFSNTRVAQLLVGYNRFRTSTLPQPGVFGQPQYDFPGATMGAPFNYPSIEGTRMFQFRYSENMTRGKHDVKFGGEFIKGRDAGIAYYSAFGRMTFLSLPSPAEMARRFPIDQWNNPKAWDLSGLDAIVQRFDLNADPGSGGVPPWNYDVPRPTFAAWFGDVWRVTSKLTVNYGVRWDDDWGAAAPPGVVERSVPINNGYASGDFGFVQDIYDHKDFAPRGGFTYNVGSSNDFVIRGGSGLYFATPVSNVTYSQQLYNRFTFATFNNDGKAGFSTDPTRGVSANDILTGKVPLPPQTTRILSPDFKMPYTWQYSVGFQKQLGKVTAIESDLVGWDWYRDTRSHDPNLFYDPTTGYNVDPRFGRPNPKYGQISYFTSNGRRDYLALSSGFTRRLQANLQGGITHTVMFFMHDDGTIGYSSSAANNDFTAPGSEWATSTDFQRNTLRAWAVYQLPLGLSVSGAYFYGSGNRFASTVSGTPYGKPGTNRLNLGAPIAIPASLQDRFDGPSVIATGAVAPRNALLGTPLHKVDLRIQEQLKLAGTARLSLIGEVFNVFNHDNYGSFVTIINNASFGQARQSLSNAYVPRSGQLGFRLSF
jgi:carboxypeptidase family protein